jgi:hypothetical protein
MSVKKIVKIVGMPHRTRHGGGLIGFAFFDHARSHQGPSRR